MSKGLEKAKELARKTNAAVVVVNETNDDAFVIMGLEEYERLVEQQETRNKKQEIRGDRHGEQSSPRDDMRGERDRHVPLSGTSDDGQKEGLGRLTEDELLAKINQEIGEWREGQVDKQNILLAEMPAQLSLKNDKGNERGGYNLVGAKVDFKVDNLEDEERYFLEPLD